MSLPPADMEDEVCQDDDDADRRAWYTCYDDDDERGLQMDWSRKHQWHELLGIDESIALVQRQLSRSHYDVILGFSQGGALLSLLAKVVPEMARHYRLIFVGAFDPLDEAALFPRLSLPGSLPRQSGLSGLSTLPRHHHPTTLHIMGSGDQVIPMEWSIELAQFFPHSLVLQHPGGHIIPSIPKSIMARFLST